MLDGHHNLPSEVTLHMCSWGSPATAAARKSTLLTLLLPTANGAPPCLCFLAPLAKGYTGCTGQQSLSHSRESQLLGRLGEGVFSFCPRKHQEEKKSSQNWKRVQKLNSQIIMIVGIIIVITDKVRFMSSDSPEVGEP